MGATVGQRVDLVPDPHQADPMVADLDDPDLTGRRKLARCDSHLPRLRTAHAVTGAESRNSLAAFSNATAERISSGSSLSVWVGSSKSQCG